MQFWLLLIQSDTPEEGMILLGYVHVDCICNSSVDRNWSDCMRNCNDFADIMSFVKL